MSAATDFATGRIPLMNARSAAYLAANDAYNAARAARLAEWQAKKAAAQIRFDRVKSNSALAGYEAASAELDSLMAEPDCKDLRDAMDAAISAADLDFRNGVLSLAASLNISSEGA